MRILKRKQKGATVIEYALIAALVSILAIAGLTAIGGSVSSSLTTISESL